MKNTSNTLLNWMLGFLLFWADSSECLENGDNFTYTVVDSPRVDKTTSACSLRPHDTSAQELIQGYIAENLRLLKYTFNVKEDNSVFSPNSTEENMLLQPYKFVLALDATGKSLLTLKEYFQPLSLHTLGYGVAEIEVELIQVPPNCLTNVNTADLEKQFKLLIFRNFGNETLSTISGKEVCNQHIHATKAEVGIIIYSCCKIDVGDNLVCRNLEETVWINVLFTTILILQVIFVLYSPSFVPSLGRMGTKFLDFTYKPTKPLQLNIVKVDSNCVISDETFVKSRHFPFVKLETLKQAVRGQNCRILYSLFVRQVHLSVKANKILPDGYSPVSCIKFLKSFFVQCKIRHDLPGLAHCCKADIFSKSDCCELPWHKCLTPVMWLVVGVILVSPWLIRIWFFYAFEEDVLELSNRVLNKKGLTSAYPGSLTFYLTPKHVIFLLIYIIIPLEVIVFTFLPAAAKRKLKFTIQMSLKSMNETKKFDAFVSFIAHLLFPFEEFGVIGVLIFPLWLLAMPFGLIILSFLIFPVVNLIVRLLLNFVFYAAKFVNPELWQNDEANKGNGILWRCLHYIREKIIVVNRFEKRSRRNMIAHVISLAMCLLTIFMLLILVVECIAFYVECVIYIIIGIILNSRDVMKFLSLTVLITWYGYDCFSSVGAKYKSFAKVINSEIQDKLGPDLKEVAMQSKEVQKEQAFTLAAMDGTTVDRMNVVAGREGYLKWNASRLVLFLDSADIPYIPKDFFFKTANLGHFSCPGPVYKMYFNALVELIWITLFLGFVMLVILAFGDSNNISGANQTLATLASGFLPFVFRKFLVRSHSGPALDKGNLTWQTTLAEAIDGHVKRWTFTNLDIITTLPTDILNAPSQVNLSLPSKISVSDTVPENVDMIVKVRQGAPAENEEMEFWVRKAKEKKQETKYIWRSGQEENELTDGEGEAVELHEVIVS